MSFEPGLNKNVTKIREDIKGYIDNFLKSGHGSVLEHVYFTFAIENVSRVFTGEMNRHRAGMAISEGSMRYIRFDDIPFWMPNSLIDTDEDIKEMENLEFNIQNREGKINACTSIKKMKSQELFRKAFLQAEENYKELCEIWKNELSETSTFKMKKHLTSMMRRIIPMGVATGGIWTGNIRALRHICEMRCSEAAEEEILLVANQILEIMMTEEPTLFGDFGKDEKGFYQPKHHKV